MIKQIIALLTLSQTLLLPGLAKASSYGEGTLTVKKAFSLSRTYGTADAQKKQVDDITFPVGRHRISLDTYMAYGDRGPCLYPFIPIPCQANEQNIPVMALSLRESKTDGVLPDYHRILAAISVVAPSQSVQGFEGNALFIKQRGQSLWLFAKYKTEAKKSNYRTEEDPCQVDMYVTTGGYYDYYGGRTTSAIGVQTVKVHDEVVVETTSAQIIEDGTRAVLATYTGSSSGNAERVIDSSGKCRLNINRGN